MSEESYIYISAHDAYYSVIMNKKLSLIVVGALIVFGVSYLVSKDRDKEPTTRTISSSEESTGSQTLDLSGQQLTTIPESVLSQKAIRSLNLSNNQIVNLPTGISRMSNLEVLNVENNRLESFPAELSQLKNLTEIRANNNRLKSIAPVFETMTWLRVLDVSGNNIPSEEVTELKDKLPNTEIKN